MDIKNRKSAKGLTLVELVMVLAVIGIASALVVPTLGNTAMTRLQSAATLLVADLGAAQIESLAHSDDLRVFVFDTGTATYHIATASDTTTPINNAVSKNPYSVTFGQGRAQSLSGVNISSVSVGGDDQLQFGPYGQLDQATAATITLTAEGNSITITVDPVTGEATIGQIQ